MWYAFLFCGLVLFGILWTATRRIRPAVKFLVMLAILGLATILVLGAVRESSVFLSGSDIRNSTAIEIAVLYLFMTTGMVSRYFTRLIEDRRAIIATQSISGESKHKPRLSFDLWEFLYPFFFSVVTYGALLGLLDEDGLTLTNILISFQTGFFWQTVLKSTAPTGSSDS